MQTLSQLKNELLAVQEMISRVARVDVQVSLTSFDAEGKPCFVFCFKGESADAVDRIKRFYCYDGPIKSSYDAHADHTSVYVQPY